MLSRLITHPPVRRIAWRSLASTLNELAFLVLLCLGRLAAALVDGFLGQRTVELTPTLLAAALLDVPIGERAMDACLFLWALLACQEYACQ